jgi:phosphohistidine phosphatase
MIENTRTLILMRHAQAVDSHRNENKARPLTPEGHRDAFATAMLLKKIGATPDLAIISPAERTRSTFEDMKEVWEIGLTPSYDDRLFSISHAEGIYSEAFDLVGEFNDIVMTHGNSGRCTLVLGHNPAIANLAHKVATALPYELTENYPTATAVVLKINAQDALPLAARHATCTHVVYNDKDKGIRLIKMPDLTPQAQPAPEI